MKTLRDRASGRSTLKCFVVRNVGELFHEESVIGRYGDMCLGKSMRWPALAYLWDVEI